MKKINSVILFFTLFIISVHAQQKELTFESLFTERAFYSSSLQGVKWFDNDQKFSYRKIDPNTRSNAIYQHDLLTGNESLLISRDHLVLEGERNFTMQNYEWSPDERYMLFTGLQHSRSVKSAGTFYIYDFAENNFFILAESETEQVNAGFSPDGKKLAFVRGNNLFTADVSSRKIKQLTFDGSDVILNGVFDWVYEEEFAIIKGWEWSPDSRSIAFWRLDQSQVPEIKIAKWDSLYLNTLDMRYPKPGANVSVIKIGVVDVSTASTTWMDIGEETDIYIPRIKYTKDPGKLSIQRLNRLQNKLDFIIADIKTGTSEVIFTEATDVWLEISDDLTFLEDGKRFIWTSEKDGYQHIYLYDLSGKELNRLTSGTWEVDKVLFADNNKVLFTGNERGTRFIDLYQVNTDGSGFRRITDKPGVNTITMSPGGNYFINIYSNSESSAVISTHNASGEKLRDISLPETNVMEDYGFSPVEFFSFTASDGTQLNASMIKPWNFDEKKKYPVLFDVYGGPRSSPLQDKWGGFGFAWKQLLAKNGYIILQVDNRGVGGRGTNFKHVVYKRLGDYEVNDMVEAANYLASLEYVDTSRLGIYGSSYGGYLAALAVMKAADYFKTGIAFAPVTDWKFYDAIYTERFMQTPELNPEGYKSSSVLTYTEQFKGNLLLIHGTADDNVHLQNTIELADKLISENKQFTTMFYPEQKHGVSGTQRRQHYYTLLLNYILEKL